MKKSHKQVFRADLVRSINSGKVESNPRDFTGPRWLRVVASSSDMKRPKMLSPQVLDMSLLMSLVDLRSPILCAMFFIICEVMEFAETRNRRE